MNFFIFIFIMFPLISRAEEVQYISPCAKTEIDLNSYYIDLCKGREPVFNKYSILLLKSYVCSIQRIMKKMEDDIEKPKLIRVHLESIHYRIENITDKLDRLNENSGMCP